MTGTADLLRTVRSLLALGRYSEVVAACRAGEIPSFPPEVALIFATAATRTGDLAAGQAAAESARRAFQGRADEDGVMHCLNLLGAIAWERGRLDEAADLFGRARQAAGRLEDQLLMARTANNLASVAHLQGRIEDARSTYREALLAYQRLGDRRGTAETYHNLELVAREDGDLEAALVAGDHAERHSALVGDPGLSALTHTGRAETAVERGEDAVAEERLARAAGLARQAGDELGLAEVERVAALRWWKRRDFDRALRSAERGRRRAAGLRSALLEAECAALAAQALAALQRPGEAARRRARARRLFRRLGATRHLERLEAEP